MPADMRREGRAGPLLREPSQHLGSLALRGGLSPQSAPGSLHRLPSTCPCDLDGAVLGWALETALLDLGSMALAPCLRRSRSPSH